MAVKSYLQLARISNLPTVLSNVLVGCALGSAGAAFPMERWAVLSLAAGALYVAGMAFNDICDLALDRQERPDRPIPAGRVSLRGAYVFTGICLLLGLGLLATQGQYALGLGLLLTVCIVSYDTLHHRFPPALVLMGACRALLYLLAAAAIAWPINWRIAAPLAAILGVYTLLVTIIASGEATRGLLRRRFAAFLTVPVALAALAVVQPKDWGWAGMAAVFLLLWIYRGIMLALHGRTRPAVLTFLAGICLLDAFLLYLLNYPFPALAAVMLFLFTQRLHRRIAGT